ncbi:hypothetical protein [Actinomycetospora chlora]|uniref:hypothetical protein n=1 Tax=Actinomycetospora chlora TaxID=663608 RepID=UPI0031E93CD6
MAARSPARLDRTGAAPLWSQLQDDLRGRIGRGEFDGAFPGELALVAPDRRAGRPGVTPGGRR